MSYEFVEAFSSVLPRVRVSQILAVAGILLDLLWRLITRNFIYPSFVDILAALLVGYYLGKRPTVIKPDIDRKRSS